MNEETKGINWTKLREQLADIEHQRWADWQKYMHSKCFQAMHDGKEYMWFPVELFDGWQKQINTEYKDLSEKEKESDRDQVRRYLPLLEEFLEKAWKYDDLANS